MGAINLDDVKKQVSDMLLAVQNLTQNNIPIPPVLKERLEKLQKQLAGNNSQQMADEANKIKPLFANAKNAEMAERWSKLAGTDGVKVKITAKPLFAEDGTTPLTHTVEVETMVDGRKVKSEKQVPQYEISFEAAGSVGGSTSGGAGTGGTKSPAKYNKYIITANEEAQTQYGYKPTETFEVGSKAKDYILNPTGKELSVDEKKSVATLNPMGRVFDFGKAASANSTLEGLAKDENFKKHLTIQMSKVEQTPEQTPEKTSAV